MPIPESFRDRAPMAPSCEKDEDVENLMRCSDNVEFAGGEPLWNSFGISAQRRLAQNEDIQKAASETHRTAPRMYRNPPRISHNSERLFEAVSICRPC